MTNDASLGSSSNYYAPYVHGFGCDLTTSWRRSLFVLIALLASPSNSFAAIPIVQEWYVPQPEDQIRADYLVLAPNTNTTTDSVIDLVPTCISSYRN